MTVSTPNTIAALPSRLLTPRPGPLRLVVLGPTDRGAAMLHWRKIEASLSNRRLMCSSIWTETWLNHYGALVPHRIVIAQRNGIACGIALLTYGVEQHDGPFQMNTWHVGTAGEPDADSVCIEYNSLLVRLEDRTEFFRQILTWINSQLVGDQTHLDGFAFDEVAPLLATDAKATVTRKQSHYFSLREAREANVEPLQLLGSRTRANLRRSMRQLGQPVGLWAATVEQAEEMLHRMIERHQARWNAVGMPGSYASRRFREFHLDLVHRLVPIGAMGMFRVKSPQGILGCAQVFIDDNRALLYQSGWSPQAGDASPGLIVDYLCLASCQERGLDYFDFMAGESEYKRRLSTHVTELAWVVWRQPRLKHVVLASLRTVKQLLKRFDASYSSAPPASETKALPAADDGH